MRWATLGFSYEWTNKTYHKDRYSTFPRLLKERMCFLMKLVEHVTQDSFSCMGSSGAGVGDGATAPLAATYEPQTAIVNYYPVGSMMMCHQDVSEETMDRPLVSASLGCSAVFLMGTESRDDAPYAFLLRSGDVAAFAGPSRRAFHAVPRILDDCPDYLTVPDEAITVEELAHFDNHCYYKNKTADGSIAPFVLEVMSKAERERYWRLCMRHLRVNINARQVYTEACPFLADVE
ncbi:alkylated DNA repair protein alkB like protein 1 [Strigomonas culicis]|nr:alkylated DNA repair protein alkB like protein 1 [Strigomonas culicis]EPY35753.1 alkylated DNA repair protein alkB like protein 1 [Strigomonas culicis]|eukprot:EPY34416.1 alkylated DNA repair protein alkB like protein 1 [Strigomonas culicis]